MTTPGRRIIESSPLNAETPLAALGDPLTPAPLFYVRNHFAIPDWRSTPWTLDIFESTTAHSARSVTLDEIRGLPRRSVVITLECAGNGRASLTPLPPGTPWRHGAVSTARFTGTPLAALLARVQLSDDTVELLFTGADRGETKPGREERYERSLPLEVARDPDVLLAWEMNDAPLAPEHGAPLRLVVPRWYGMASVKWLTRIRSLARPFTGYFQTEHYVYRGAEKEGVRSPVTRVRVRSIITTPHDGAELSPGAVEVRGAAWSGNGAIKRVRVSTDGGDSWGNAELGTPASELASTPWSFQWTPTGSGDFTILARARDASGAEQPLEGEWNALGYGNNAIHRVRVRIPG